MVTKALEELVAGSTPMVLSVVRMEEVVKGSTGLDSDTGQNTGAPEL
jgi:hypothetical protein